MFALCSTKADLNFGYLCVTVLMKMSGFYCKKKIVRKIFIFTLPNIVNGGLHSLVRVRDHF